MTQSATIDGNVAYIMDKLDLKKGMSVNRAIVNVSELIDNQHDPGKFSNGIIQKLSVPLGYVSDVSQAKILALAVVEQLIVSNPFDPDTAADIAATKLAKLNKKLPFLFKEKLITAPKKKGSKRDAACKIFMDNKHLSNKEVIALIAKELDVTLQNAYTYVYLIKKDLKI